MKIAMRTYMAAVLALAVGNAFAQGTDDNAFKRKVADAAAKYKNHDASGALTDFMALYGENSKSADVNSWIGFLQLQKGAAKEAVPFLERAKSGNPRDLEVLNNLGNAYMMSGNKAKALSTYQELITLDGNRFEAFYNMGNIQLEDKHYSQAEASYTKALGLRKGTAQILNNLGIAQENQKKLEAAAGSFIKASDTEKTEATYARNAGAINYRIQKYATAVTYLERAISNGSRDKKLVLALGDSYERVGRHTDHVRLLDKNQDLFAGDAEYYFNLGLLKKQDKDSEGAIKAFQRALDLKPNFADALDNIGVLNFNAGNYAEARKNFEQLMAMDNSVRVKKNFAAAASREGDYRAAMPVWSQILQADKNDSEVRLLLADALYETGDTKASLTMYKQILASNANSATAMDGLGRCHLRDANYAAAEAALRGAIKADKNYVPAYNNLAVVLEKMNKRSEAIALLEKAASLDANNADVQKNLKRMRAAG